MFVVLVVPVVVLVVVVVHTYLYRRLVRTTATGRVRHRIGAGALAVLAASPVAAVGLGLRLPPPVTAAVDRVGYGWLAVAMYLVLTLLVLEAPWWWLRRRTTDPARRRALARLVTGAAGLVAAGTVGYGVVEARSPRLVRREVPLERLSPGLDGMTLAVLSDIHLGGVNRAGFLAEVVRRVNAETPDLVAVVGDLVDGSVAELGAQAAPLGGLAAPAFFVTGNHEYFHHAERWCEFLPTLGVRVLRNERVEVTRRDAPLGAPALQLAGIDDRFAARSGEPGHRADLDAALAGRDPARPVVLLAHQPVLVGAAAHHGVDLLISGHTHGGQYLPFGYLVLLDQPVLAGLSRVGRTWLYVTRGVGFWGPPVRVGAPPEITLLTLRTARPAG